MEIGKMGKPFASKQSRPSKIALLFFDTHLHKTYLCNAAMLWREVPPGCGTKLWQLWCAALSLRSPPQPPSQSHHSLHWGEGSCWLGGQRGPKAVTLFPILSLPEPLLQTLSGLRGPGSAPSYSSPPGNPLSGASDVAYSAMVPNEVVWVPRVVLYPLNSYWSDFSCWFFSLIAPYCISGWNGQASKWP